MSKETKLKIGEFSKMMQVTVKTLRYYEQKGLLLPYEVDEWTGYRYYSIYQMQRLNIIRGLQQQGFTLEEIKELLEDGEQMPSIDQLTQKIEETEHQLQLLIKRRSQLLKWLDSHKQIKTMEKVNIQSLPEIIVASHREIIPNYDALGALCVNKIGPEMQRLGCKCPPPGYCFTIEHNKEYRSTDLDIEYCEQVEEKGKDNNIIQFKHLPAVEKALCIKHLGGYERFHESFAEAFRYMEEKGYKPIGHTRICYIDGVWNKDNPEQWLSIIQIPIE
jgi:DNA-binding transcriptional MerR regulator